MWTLALAAAASSVDVLVLQPEGAGLAADGRAALTQALTLALDGRDGLRVSSVVDVQQLADVEAARQAVDCGDDGACLAEIGAAFGARQMVTGRIASLGSQLVWQATLLDVQSGVATRRAEVAAGDLEGLVAAAPDLAKALLPRPPSTTRLLALGGGGAGLAVGAVTAAVAGLWTLAINDALTNPTSAEAQARAFDEAAVVPWVFVGGSVVAVVGGGVLVTGSLLE